MRRENAMPRGNPVKKTIITPTDESTDESTVEPVFKKQGVETHDCTIVKEFDFDLSSLRKDHEGGPIIRHFFIVRHKNGSLHLYYVSTGTSNDNGISAGTVLGCVGVSTEKMRVRPIEAIAQLDEGIETTYDVVDPGTVIKINDIYKRACASWQAELFFKILLKGDSIIPFRDLANLFTLTRNFSSWPCFQISAFIGGGWWETREPFRRFVLNHDYNASSQSEKIFPRSSEFSVNRDDAEHVVGEPRLLPNEDIVFKDEFPELISSDEIFSGRNSLKEYLNIINIVEHIKSTELERTSSPGTKNISEMIDDIVSLFPEDHEESVRIILGNLQSNKNLLLLFQSLLPDSYNIDKTEKDGEETQPPPDEIGGGRPKTRKKRRTKRRTRKSKKSRKSRKRKL